MEQRIQECLTGNAATEYILPFFWQHGEDHAALAEEIDAIYKSGIREFCVESRTHEQFGQEKWWEDFAFLLEEATRKNMKVWLLDDKLFLLAPSSGNKYKNAVCEKSQTAFLYLLKLNISSPSKQFPCEGSLPWRLHWHLR